MSIRVESDRHTLDSLITQQFTYLLSIKIHLSSDKDYHVVQLISLDLYLNQVIFPKIFSLLFR